MSFGSTFSPSFFPDFVTEEHNQINRNDNVTFGIVYDLAGRKLFEFFKYGIYNVDEFTNETLYTLSQYKPEHIGETVNVIVQYRYVQFYAKHVIVP